MIDLIINFGLRILDFFLEIIAIIFTLIFSVLQPLLWVIIPLFILNKIITYFFDTSLIEIIKTKKKTRRKKA